VGNNVRVYPQDSHDVILEEEHRWQDRKGISAPSELFDTGDSRWWLDACTLYLVVWECFFSFDFWTFVSPACRSRVLIKMLICGSRHLLYHCHIVIAKRTSCPEIVLTLTNSPLSLFQTQNK
jgi:hypothetical protein